MNIKAILKDNKKLSNILIFALAGLALIMIGDILTSSKNTSTQVSTDSSEAVIISNYEEKKKEELKNILEMTSGVGSVEVMLSFESGEEVVPAVNVTDSVTNTKVEDNSGGKSSTTSENNGSTVVMKEDNGNTEPLIIKKYNPKVTGAYIVSRGADSELIKLQIKNIVSKLFDIPMEKVNVMSMKK